MNPADRQILDHFRQIRERTLDLLERLPEELLDQTADGEDRPLRHLFVHLARTIDNWMSDLLKDGLGLPVYGVDKGSLELALRISADRVISFFEADDGERMGREIPDKLETTGKPVIWTGRDRVLYLTAHEIHHRGKMVLALRQAGFADIPPMPMDW
jgi:uncharacterized damage-inducible protein DinB